MMNKAIVIVGYDPFCDVWPIFFECLDRYWRRDQYPIYLVTNELKPELKNVTVIPTGVEKSWSEKVLTALSQIPEESIMLLLEDYLIGKQVDEQLIEDLFSTFERENMDYLRIVPIPKLKYKDKKKGLHVMREDTLYGVTLQPSIFKKSFLIALLSGKPKTIWEIEKRQKYENDEDKLKGNFYALDYFAIYTLNGIIKGKWDRKTIKFFKKAGFPIDTSSRGKLSKKQSFKHYFTRFWMGKLSVKQALFMKKILKKFGKKFTT